MAIDLSKLPAPEAIEILAYDQIVADIKSEHVALNPQAAAALDLASEPIVKLIETFAGRELRLRAKINDNFKQSSPAFATGNNLDHMASIVGVPRLEGESDEKLRARVQLAPDSWSVAGPEAAYQYFAQSVSPLIAHVEVTSPNGAEVAIKILMANGNPPPEILAAVSAVLSQKIIRPIGDRLSVSATVRDIFNPTISLSIKSGADSQIVRNLAEVAIRAYCAAERKNGGEIEPSKLLGVAAAIEGVRKATSENFTQAIGGIAGHAPELGDLTIVVA